MPKMTPSAVRMDSDTRIEALETGTRKFELNWSSSALRCPKLEKIVSIDDLKSEQGHWRSHSAGGCGASFMGTDVEQ